MSNYNYLLEANGLYSLASLALVESKLGPRKKFFYNQKIEGLERNPEYKDRAIEILKEKGFDLLASKESMSGEENRQAKGFGLLFFNEDTSVAITLKYYEGSRYIEVVSSEEYGVKSKELTEILPGSKEKIEDSFLKVRFQAMEGSKYRSLDLPKFEEISKNYVPEVRASVESLIPKEFPEKDGKLIIWHGLAGSGKTYAIRALAREWASRYHAGITVVTDPENFLNDSKYMLNVLLSDIPISAAGKYKKAKAEGSLPPERLHLLILEDQGQLFTSNCRLESGFTKFLNITDGLIGQGIRVIFLISFNESFTEMDSALKRPGRCLQIQEFGPLESEKACKFIEENASSNISDLKKLVSNYGGSTLADLYAMCKTPSDFITEKIKPVFTGGKEVGFVST